MSTKIVIRSAGRNVILEGAVAVGIVEDAVVDVVVVAVRGGVGDPDHAPDVGRAEPALLVIMVPVELPPFVLRFRTDKKSTMTHFFCIIKLTCGM